jgi:hypothetical protein
MAARPPASPANPGKNNDVKRNNGNDILVAVAAQRRRAASRSRLAPRAAACSTRRPSTRGAWPRWRPRWSPGGSGRRPTAPTSARSARLRTCWSRWRPGRACRALAGLFRVGRAARAACPAAPGAGALTRTVLLGGPGAQRESGVHTRPPCYLACQPQEVSVRLRSEAASVGAATAVDPAKAARGRGRPGSQRCLVRGCSACGKFAVCVKEAWRAGAQAGRPLPEKGRVG